MQLVPITSPIPPAPPGSAMVPASYYQQLPPIPYPAVMQMPAAAAPTRIIALEDIVRCIVARWKTAALLAAITGALLFALMAGRVKIYQAEARLIMRMEDNKVFNFEKVVNGSAEAQSAHIILNNHKNQLRSRRFLTYFYENLPAEERNAFLAAPTDVPLVARVLAKLKHEPEAGPLEGDAIREAFIFNCLESGSVDFVSETLIVKISIKHHSPDAAAGIANAWVRNYIRYTGEEDNASTREATKFLATEVSSLKERLEKSEAKLAAYTSEKGLLPEAEQSASDSEKLKLLSTEQARLSLEQARVEETLRQILAAGDDEERLLSIDALAVSASVSALRTQLSEKLRQRELIESEYGPKHPASISFQREFTQLKNEIRMAATRVTSEVKFRKESLASQITDITRQVTETRNQLNGAGTENIERNILRKQVEADRALYDKLATRLDEASVSSRYNESTNLREADEAAPPLKPISPNKPLSLVLAGFGSSVVFVTVPLVLALISLLRTKGIEGILQHLRGAAAGVPAAAVAPTAPDPAAQYALHAGAQPQQFPTQFPTAPALPPPAGMITIGELPELPLAPSGRLDQMLAQCFRGNDPGRAVLEGAAARLVAGVAHGQSQVILVTGTHTGEGKSIVAAGLGAALLTMGKSVCVIDGNLRRPTLSDWLPRLTRGMTLADLSVTGGQTMPDMQGLRCGGSDLYTLTAGGSAVSFLDPFSQPWFGNLLSFLRSRVSVVIIDAPSLTEAPDIVLLAAHATHAVIVENPALHHAMGTPQISPAAALRHIAPNLSVTTRLINHGPASA